MSWWNVPDSHGDVTGDAPADAVDGALLGLAEARAGAGASKPSLPELLCALERTLAERRDLFEGLPSDFRVATRDGVAAAGEAPADLVEAVGQALEGIAGVFRADWQRPPRPAEALYPFTFALGGQPESILRPPFPKPIVIVLSPPH
jgi:hypothetical protein